MSGFFFYFVCTCFYTLGAYSDCRNQQMALDHLGPELQPVVTCQVGARIERRSFGREASAPNH